MKWNLNILVCSFGVIEDQGPIPGNSFHVPFPRHWRRGLWRPTLHIHACSIHKNFSLSWNNNSTTIGTYLLLNLWTKTKLFNTHYMFSFTSWVCYLFKLYVFRCWKTIILHQRAHQIHDSLSKNLSLLNFRAINN